MKHFFIIWFFFSVILFVWVYILENIGGLNLNQLKHDNGILCFLLVISPSACFSIIYGFIYDFYFTDDNPEETPKEKTKTENLKTDNPENDEIITVTEIKGVKKIIKNGKVIYCEQLKADELKVFEQLNEKNPTVTSGIKTYTKE